jgi:hypothetical protein
MLSLYTKVVGEVWQHGSAMRQEDIVLCRIRTEALDEVAILVDTRKICLWRLLVDEDERVGVGGGLILRSDSD